MEHGNKKEIQGITPNGGSEFPKKMYGENKKYLKPPPSHGLVDGSDAFPFQLANSLMVFGIPHKNGGFNKVILTLKKCPPKIQG